MQEFIITSIDELNIPANAVIELLSDYSVVAFYGEMGVGKTTFIKIICEQLGVNDYINSPTFAIVNEYADANQEPIYHFDLYRLEDVDELMNIGADEYFYSGFPCFIEWPEKGEEALPDERLNIFIEEINNGDRKIKIVKN